MQEALAKSLTDQCLSYCDTESAQNAEDVMNGNGFHRLQTQNEMMSSQSDKNLENGADINEFQSVCDEQLLPNDSKWTQYNLRSIVRHLGSNYQCGHYITDVLDENGDWKRHDDKYVSSITDAVATNNKAQKNAYIFFYVHQSAVKK